MASKSEERAHNPVKCRYLRNAIKRYPDDALRLHEAGVTTEDEWTTNADDEHDTVELSMGALSVFEQSGAIEKISHRGYHTGNTWRICDGVRDLIEEDVVPRSRTPCGCSTGVITVEAGELYTCKNPDCDRTFDRETALEVVG